MIIFAYIWIFFIIFTSFSFFLIVFVEKRIDENSKFGKWWRRHIVDLEPKDDNTK